ncbi:hypothetical protein [Pseudodesulfovibrio sediminis]|uniref:Uncharacterized protein n=1 Tax=Pseudodesulfovibrio sediminis TaxID=2810563 RepID=A0ABN6EPQ3_9BACT|nr:hypothetical protein [Pseudodesulfovibrio sediminis]BCS87407.1 hypothetical protein PSDVSF_06490 [Pseudodesulfovibrio sediminis]
MSTTPLDLPILIAQLPYVQKIAHAEKAKPEIQRQLFNPLLRENIEKQQGKVQQVEKKTATDPIQRDGHSAEQQQASSERKKKETEDEASSDTGSSNPSPWAGNIVNVKI